MFLKEDFPDDYLSFIASIIKGEKSEDLYNTSLLNQEQIDKYKNELKNEINKICENYKDNENILKLIKIYEKRIGNEINFIHIYLDKMKDV